MQKYVILLGAGKNQLPFIQEAQNMGYKTIVFDIEKKIASIKADLFYEISIYKEQEIINILKTLNYRYKAIIARVSSLNGLITAYNISKVFNLPFISKQLLKIGTNKNDLYKFCIKNNILTPKTWSFKNIKDTNNLELKLNSKYIIKPEVTKIGKKNITLFESKKELINIFQLVKDVSYSKKVLIQEYIEGIDIGIFTIFNNGKFNIIASIDEINGFENNKVKAIAIQTPSLLCQNEKMKKQLNEILAKFSKILDNEKYFIAFSFRIDRNDNIYLIEIHIDLTGDLIMDKLLPIADKNFNFFNFFIDFLISNNKEIKTYDFNKTLLVFNDKIYLNQSIKSFIEILKNIQNINKSYLDYLDEIKDNNELS